MPLIKMKSFDLDLRGQVHSGLIFLCDSPTGPNII
jgi:hypothetical protein